MDNTSDEAELDPAPVREGFVRQRRALIVVSLALLAFQEIGARLDHIEILGNSISLVRPMNLATPLWIAWFYFLARYYQYFRDLGDISFRSAVDLRVEHLARKAAAKKLRSKIQPDLSEATKPHWKIEIEELDLVSRPPGFWRFLADGWIHVTDEARPTWQASQILQGVEVYLDPGVPRFAQIRGIAWVLLHTRLMTEYALPFFIAGTPLLLLLAHRFGLRLLI